MGGVSRQAIHDRSEYPCSDERGDDVQALEFRAPCAQRAERLAPEVSAEESRGSRGQPMEQTGLAYELGDPADDQRTDQEDDRSSGAHPNIPAEQIGHDQ